MAFSGLDDDDVGEQPGDWWGHPNDRDQPGTRSGSASRRSAGAGTPLPQQAGCAEEDRGDEDPGSGDAEPLHGVCGLS